MHDDDQVDLPVLQPQRQVLVVVLELVRRGVVAGAEHGVVVTDRRFQEVARRLVEGVGLEALFVEVAVLFGFVRRVGVDQPNLQPAIGRQRLLLLGELGVVALGSLDRRRGEQRVEALDAAGDLDLLDAVAPGSDVADVGDQRVHVAASAPGLLVEVLQRVADDLGDPTRVEQRSLGVDGWHLLVLDVHADLDRVDVVDAERQHVLVGDRVDDRVGVQPLTERLLGGAQPRVTTRAWR